MINKRSGLLLLLFTIFGSAIYALHLMKSPITTTGAPPYGEDEQEIPVIDPMAWIKDWTRPAGPPKVALQVGHLHSDQFPDELSRLRNNTGASGGGYTERGVNEDLANRVAELLQPHGVQVEILPATVPPDYWADVFMAIHADGSTDTSASGYKIAGPWRDLTGKSDDLTTFLETEYEAATKLAKDPNITRNMRGYYAFSWWRYEHSIHPMTTAVIVETGFITNPSDRRLLTRNADVPAQALAKGVLAYLESEGLMSNI